MQPAAPSLKQYYAARAREYETVYAKPERQADLRRLEAIVSRLFAGRRVVEVACGTGYWTSFIASEAREVVGVDASAEMLEVAAGKQWPPGRVRFQVADAYALPDDLGTFDAALGGFWFSHVPIEERPRFLASLDRRYRERRLRLRPRGARVRGPCTRVRRRSYCLEAHPADARAWWNTRDCRATPKLHHGRNYANTFCPRPGAVASDSSSLAGGPAWPRADGVAPSGIAGRQALSGADLQRTQCVSN